MSEEWRKIPGKPYAVSNHGRVKRLDSGDSYAFRRTYPGRILKLCIDSTGYPSVNLLDKRRGKPWPYRIHVLVAEAFLPPRPEGHEVNHKDFDQQNNHVSNLEWLTRSENQKHAHAHGRIPPLPYMPGEAHPNARFSQKEARAIRYEHGVGGISVKDLAKKYDVGKSTIRRIVRHRSYKEEAYERFQAQVL